MGIERRPRKRRSRTASSTRSVISWSVPRSSLRTRRPMPLPPNEVAYALCEAIEKRRKLIPSDNFKPIDMRQLCANDEEAPFHVPLHPGARRF